MGTDRIEITGLRAVGIHGVLPEEQQRSQPFEVDVCVHVDLGTASASDDLDDTLDYGALCESVARIVSTEQYRLLEALAGRIADVALSDDRVAAAEVTVRKVRPPVPVDVDRVGVTVRRSRS
ncbi:MAG TPA: dihydroneopterin aldolase [Acidimicrobiales bacterium]|jgi:dihydroneopterin aldolase